MCREHVCFSSAEKAAKRRGMGKGRITVSPAALLPYFLLPWLPSVRRRSVPWVDAGETQENAAAELRRLAAAVRKRASPSPVP